MTMKSNENEKVIIIAMKMCEIINDNNGNWKLMKNNRRKPRNDND